jgi:hypothetical protein
MYDVLYDVSVLLSVLMLIPSRRRSMPIRQFIKGEMGSADINRLNVAYAKALRMLHLTDRHDAVTEIVAKRIIDIGTSGVTDPQDIAEAVVKQLKPF